MQLAESLLPPAPPKPVASGSLFTAYAFSVNFILGAGVLGLPFAFHKAGVLLSCLFLIFVSFVAILSITWIVETLARAETFLSIKRQASHVRQHADPGIQLPEDDDDALLRSMADSELDDDDDDMAGERVIVNQDTGDDDGTWMAVQRTSPPFLIRKRKIEMGELCELFLGKSVRRFFEFSITCYVYGSLWLYASIFASSLVSAIPVVHLTSTFECDIQDNKTPGYCQDAYYIYIGIYSCLSLILVMRDLSNQKKLQIGLSMMAIFGIFMMILTTLINMGTQPLDQDDSHTSNTTSTSNHTSSPPYIEDSTLLNFSGFGKLFTAALFSQVCHYGIPSLVQLIPNEKKVHANKVFFSATTTTCICYCLLGVTTALYYGSHIETIITLNWQQYHGAVDSGSLPAWVYIIRYFIVLFPAVLVTAAFPLNAIALSNNLVDAFPTSLTTRFSPSAIRIICRLISSIPPLIAALFLPNASTILNITGLFAFVLAFWIPCMLVIASRRQSVARWGQSAAVTPYSWHFSHFAYVYAVFAFSIGAFIFTVVELIHPF